MRLDLNSKLPHVFGDRTQLQQAILNLIINGFEAMGGVGDGSRELVVRASQGESDNAIISVQDSGIGIDDEERELVFNAFFTTKDEGIGMGLSISQSIIEDHGGRNWATRNTRIQERRFPSPFLFTRRMRDDICRCGCICR